MFYCVVAYFKPNFSSIAHSDKKLWIVKVWKLDVCGRPFFANPIANRVYVLQGLETRMKISRRMYII